MKDNRKLYDKFGEWLRINSLLRSFALRIRIASPELEVGVGDSAGGASAMGLLHIGHCGFGRTVGPVSGRADGHT